MAPNDTEATWRDYYQRKKAQRLEEAVALWRQMDGAGVSAATLLAVDFLHFSQSEENAVALAKQILENYQVEVVPAQEDGYWYIKGTTRPYGITLTEEQHAGWVEFMADVAQSYACVFSSWSLEAPSLGVKFTSEHLESAS